jgi:hypothetical protein
MLAYFYNENDILWLARAFGRYNLSNAGLQVWLTPRLATTGQMCGTLSGTWQPLVNLKKILSKNSVIS